MTQYKFFHGLGDAALFARMVPLYTKRGIPVEIEATPDKHVVFQAGGAKIIPLADSNHPWYMPTLCFHPNEPWRGNKAGESLLWKEDWNALCDSEVSIRSLIPQEDWDFIEEKIEHWRRPIILWHPMGNTGQAEKNYSKDQQEAFLKEIVQKTDGTVVIMDWDSRVHWALNHRIKHMQLDIAILSTTQVAALMFQSDLFFGIDSGPSYLAALTDIPASISFHLNRPPSLAALPSPRTIFFHCAGNREEARFKFQVIDHPNHIDWSLKLLERSAADVHLEATIEKCQGGFIRDRNKTFAKFLSAPLPSPIIVETGCVRAYNDWQGAGASTPIFARFAQMKGGKFTSIDNDFNHVTFAKNMLHSYSLPGEVICERGSTAIAKFDKIDLLYLDSMDTEHEAHADCNLEEFQAAEKALHKNSLVLIDDTPSLTWGKGTKTIPYALERGWRILYAGYQVLLCKS